MERFNKTLIGLIYSLAIFLSSCTSTETAASKAQSAQTSQCQSSQSNSSSQPSNQKQDTLSYGMVTSKVEKNVTTQAQLLELFGGPNIATTDSDGLETWVYERTATQSQMSHESNQNQDTEVNSQVKRLGIFFGLGITGNEKANAKVESHSNATSNTSVTSSIRSLTVIVKFNKDKKVSDYNVRTANF